MAGILYFYFVILILRISKKIANSLIILQANAIIVNSDDILYVNVVLTTKRKGDGW